MEPEQDTKTEMIDCFTGLNFKNNYVEEELKKEKSAEVGNENLKSVAISQSNNSMLTSAESFKDLREAPSEEMSKQPANPEDARYSHTMYSNKELFVANLSRPRNKLNVIESCRNLVGERKQLMLKNILLQKKLHEYYKRKKAEGTYVDSKLDGLEGSQSEFLYRKNLSTFEDVLDQSSNEKTKMDLKLKELLKRRNESLNIAAEEVDSLLKAEEIYGNGLLRCCSGKIIQVKEVSFLVNRHKEVIADSSLVLLKYIRVRDALSEKEASLKFLENLGKGLSLIDYEVLLIDKLDMQNKIEERNAALDYFNGKIEADVVAMSHFKEKISNFAEMMERNLQLLDEYNYLLHMHQDKKAAAKKQMNELRREIKILHHKAGLLVNPTLLRDFDDTSLQLDEIKHEVNELKMKLKMLPSEKDKSLIGKSKHVNGTSFLPNYYLFQKISNDVPERNDSKKQFQKLAGAHNGKICKGRPSIDKIERKDDIPTLYNEKHGKEIQKGAFNIG